MSLREKLLSLENASAVIPPLPQSPNKIVGTGTTERAPLYDEYVVVDPETVNGSLGSVKFQTGPLKEVGTNGVFVEDLLAIAEHRLLCYQQTEYACPENTTAIRGLRSAQHALKARTEHRTAAGTEGTAQVDSTEKRLIRFCSDDYDDGMFWLVSVYTDGTSEEHKRWVKDDAGYELIQRLFDYVTDSELLKELVFDHTSEKFEKATE
jgi:hypothetical protein